MICMEGFWSLLLSQLLVMVKGCVPKPGLLHGHTLCRWEVGKGQDRWGLGSEGKEKGGGRFQGAEETVRFPGSWSCFPSLMSSTVSGPMKERLDDVSGAEVHCYELSTLSSLDEALLRAAMPPSHWSLHLLDVACSLGF